MKTTSLWWLKQIVNELCENWSRLSARFYLAAEPILNELLRRNHHRSAAKHFAVARQNEAPMQRPAWTGSGPQSQLQDTQEPMAMSTPPRSMGSARTATVSKWLLWYPKCTRQSVYGSWGEGEIYPLSWVKKLSLQWNHLILQQPLRWHGIKSIHIFATQYEGLDLVELSSASHNSFHLHLLSILSSYPHSPPGENQAATFH